MVKINAAEAEISWLLIPSMGQAPMNSGSYVSHNATCSSFLLHSLCLVISHPIQTPRLQFVTQTLCYKCVISKLKSRP